MVLEDSLVPGWRGSHRLSLLKSMIWHMYGITSCSVTQGQRVTRRVVLRCGCCVNPEAQQAGFGTGQPLVLQLHRHLQYSNVCLCTELEGSDEAARTLLRQSVRAVVGR